MKEIKCPQCGSVIEVDDNFYAQIVEQVRNQFFNEELARREKELREQIMAQVEAATTKSEQAHKDTLHEKDGLIRDREVEIEVLKTKLDALTKGQEAELNNRLLVQAQENEAKLQVQAQEIFSLKAQLEKRDNQQTVAVLEERERCTQQIHKHETTIADLKNQVEREKGEAALRESELRKQQEEALRMKDEEIERYRDFKTRLSTKMLGETLEIHCANVFNEARSNGQYLSAYFGKDNEVVEGTKGDFVFRDYAPGDEKPYISIMFEMKNEADTTATKHRNVDFLKKLDEDRRKKGCDYAVLVTMLEPDNEFYNRGIVNMSYQYPGMFIVRPQQFMTIVGLLSTLSRKTIDLRHELELARQQSIDVTKFEEKWGKFQASFFKYCEQSEKKTTSALEGIDKAIEQLQKIRALFADSQKSLQKASDQVEGITIKKLTHGNPTMKAKFEVARLLGVSNHLIEQNGLDSDQDEIV